MNSWATRRKAIYLGGLILVLGLLSFFIFWKFWYMAPSCSDNTQNGDEVGVDCGGSCSLICRGDAVMPIVRWDPRLFEILPGLWSVLVYVENPNTNIDAVYVPYVFTIYDEDNNILEERKGSTILPKNKTVGVFEGSINVKDGIKPKRAIFEIGEDVSWEKNENEPDNISVAHSPLLRTENAPRVEANIRNNGTKEVKNIELVVAIFDGSDNVIAASRTFVESLKKNSSSNIFFTWPKPFDLGFKVCERPSDTMLLLDRSGSMASIKIDPPQPLSDAKDAAAFFVEQLNPKDKVGVVSFANKAKEPIDSNLTSDFNFVTEAIKSISIGSDGTQYTNIYEALHFGWQELVSARAQEKSSKVVVLLTDGVANNPRNPTGGTEEDDIKYAEDLAIKEALSAKKDGLMIYTIGLGDKINETFLKNIASKVDNYYFAPSALNLESIYKSISSDICKEIPARIEITYKIFGDLI